MAAWYIHLPTFYLSVADRAAFCRQGRGYLSHLGLEGFRTQYNLAARAATEPLK